MERRRHGPAAGLKLGYAASAQIVSGSWADAWAQAAADEAAMGSGPGEPASGSAAYSTSFRIFCTESSCSRS